MLQYIRTYSVVIAAITAICFAPAARANEWVGGKVSVLSDYSAYSPSLGILITLTDQQHGPTTASVCSARYRIVAGMENVDESLKNRFLSMLLSAKLAQQKVWLYVGTYPGLDGYCPVQIVTIGETIY